MNDMLGVFIIYQMGVKYNTDMGCRFVCHPYSDFSGFCDPTSRLPGYNPIAKRIHDVWVGANLSTPTFLSWWVWCSHILW